MSSKCHKCQKKTKMIYQLLWCILWMHILYIFVLLCPPCSHSSEVNMNYALVSDVPYIIFVQVAFSCHEHCIN